jgi:hypothetical protein
MNVVCGWRSEMQDIILEMPGLIADLIHNLYKQGIYFKKQNIARQNNIS